MAVCLPALLAGRGHRAMCLGRCVGKEATALGEAGRETALSLSGGRGHPGMAGKVTGMRVPDPGGVLGEVEQGWAEPGGAGAP